LTDLKKYAVLSALLFIACAGSRAPEINENDWVEQTLNSMSVNEKVGQMMVVGYSPRMYNDRDSEFQRLKRLVREYRIGGVMFFRGEAYAAARTIERLQSVAPLPLLVFGMGTGASG